MSKHDKKSASSIISVRDGQIVKDVVPAPEDRMSSRKRESQYSAHLTLEKTWRESEIRIVFYKQTETLLLRYALQHKNRRNIQCYQHFASKRKKRVFYFYMYYSA
jgi:hypothetical protein